MKGKPSKKRQLHQTPPEFARAKRAQEISRHWRNNQERCRNKAKKDSERVMPAHPKPKGKMRVLYHAQGHPVYEDIAEYRKRVWNRAHRRAHKTTVPPKG